MQYAPWISDIELAFYSSLSNLKINHDKLDSSARKVLGLYEIQNRDPPGRSTRMQIHGTALTGDEYAALSTSAERIALTPRPASLLGFIEVKASFATSIP